jgi:Domain of unknown function (DUF6916)
MDGALQKSMSRSGLLKLGAVAAFVFGAGPASRALASETAGRDGEAAAAGRPVPGPAYLRLATYVPLVGSTFRIHRPGTPRLSVTLVSATALPSEIGESFSLIFRGHGDAKLGQETYTIEHSSLGRFPLFLVPVGPAGKGQEFQAIVNRIPSSLMPRV